MTEAQKAKLIILDVANSILDSGDPITNAAKLNIAVDMINEYITKEEREAKEMQEFWLDKHQLAQEIN